MGYIIEKESLNVLSETCDFKVVKHFSIRRIALRTLMIHHMINYLQRKILRRAEERLKFANLVWPFKTGSISTIAKHSIFDRTIFMKIQSSSHKQYEF